MYKELKKLNKKSNNTINKWPKKVNRLQEMKYHCLINARKVPNFTDTREAQIQTLLRFCLTQVRLVGVKETSTNVDGEDVDKRNSYTLLLGMRTSLAAMEHRMEVPQKLKLGLPYDALLPSWACNKRCPSDRTQRDVPIGAFCSTVKNCKLMQPAYVQRQRKW